MNDASVSPLTEVGEKVARARYYKKDEQGNVIENWAGLTKRIVDYVCKDEDEDFKEKIYDLIYTTKFLPNTPCLVNAGREIKNPGLSACYVTKAPDDSWEEIILNIKRFGEVARAAGGCGVSFSKIRPEGSPVFGSAHAKACGPIEAMRMVSEAMSSITQSGVRGMANMGTLRVSHPDIFKFIRCKQRGRALRTLLKEDIFGHYDDMLKNTHEQLNVVLDKFISNFNISVVVSDKFMRAVEEDTNWDLEFNGKIYETIKARKIFREIAENAWKNGDPGLLFEDAVNDGPYKFSGQWIDATNPCVIGSTIVITKDGPKQIKDIIGYPCEILSHHNDEFIWTWTDGSYLTKREAETLVIETENTKITCTPDHLILTKGGFVEGQSIEIGQMILSNPCGLGVSYGLEDQNNRQWEGTTEELDRLLRVSSSREGHAGELVSRRVWVEEDFSDDCDFRMDLCTFKKVFSSKKHAAPREKNNHRHDQETQISECLWQKEPVLQMDRKSDTSTKNKEIQLRLVSIADSGKSVLAQFVRVDNGDVLRFKAKKLENGSSVLYTTERRELSARLFHLLQKWQAVGNHRSQEQIHNGTSWLQSGNAAATVASACSSSVQYIALCSKTFEFYKKVPIRMEKVVRITKGRTEDVFDLTTNHISHNFVANGLIVHNCGEQPMPHFSVCNLGSQDISKYYDPECEDEFDWRMYKQDIHICIRFLDNVVERNCYPSKEFADWAKDNRPVGLGVMGLADLLLKRKIAYGSKKSIEFAEKIASFLEDEAHKASVRLAKIRGVPKSCRYKELDNRRNVTLTSIAPTGSISLLAGCSSSVEPIFSPTIHRYDNTGQYVLAHPDADKPYFRCALDKDENGRREVSYQQHIAMQAAFQKYGSSGISKTINMPNSATIRDVESAYMMAWRNKCKGVTIYRDGCKTTQVLNTNSKHIMRTNSAADRPDAVPCDIFKTRADGFDWHIIIGTVENNPYELFAVNGRVELPKSGRIIKKKKRHYCLVDQEDNTLIDNLVEEEKDIDPRIGLETRRFSLELRHGIEPKFIVEQIDKSTAVVTSFSKAVGRIMKTKYLTSEDCVAIAEDIACPCCAKEGKQVSMVCEAGCFKCLTCHYAKCG